MFASGRRDRTMRVVLLAILCFGVAVGVRTRRGFERTVASPRPGALRWLQLLATDYRFDGGDGTGPDNPRSRSISSLGPTYPLQAIPFEIPTSVVGARGAVPILLLPIPITEPRSSQRDDESSRKTGVVEDTSQHGGSPAVARPQLGIRGGAISVAPTPTLVQKRPIQDDKERTRDPGVEQVENSDENQKNPFIGVSAVASKDLLAKFIAQKPTAPDLPPIVLSDHDSSERILRPPIQYSEDQPQTETQSSLASQPILTALPSRNSREPSRPRMRRALLMEARLRVPRADYTERYIAWWDAASGAARVDFHGGSTSTFRWVNSEGAMQRLEMRVDRTGAGDVRRCGVAGPAPVVSAQQAHPAMPDLELFSFAGFEQSDEGRAERWTHEAVTRGGRADGEEILTFHHELLLIRSDIGVRPLRYAVSVDSSVLGPGTDGYEHRYMAVRELNEASEFFSPNIDDMCDSVETLNPTTAEHFARLEPLKEFTLPQRDSRYDEAFERFKVEYNRQYIDGTEEAMRKNVFIQHKRFIESANREGATFQVGVNFLTDRLNVELDKLLGVEKSVERSEPEPFPYTRSRLNAEQARLPKQFDWRPRGAVTPVRFQNLTCSSCWAIAVTGAIEGALFVRTRRLTPLSEKCLVDCAKPFGGNGCMPTFPDSAYDYVKSRGLPALEEYPPYKPEEETCVEDGSQPVTRISSHVNVLPNSVPALQVAIRYHAPTVVIINAKIKSFFFYKKGVVYDDRCSKSPDKLVHAVLAVGWGERKGDPHIIVKNSWSEKWGDKGYARIHGRSNTCGVLDDPSYPRLEHSDVLRAPSSEQR